MLYLDYLESSAMRLLNLWLPLGRFCLLFSSKKLLARIGLGLENTEMSYWRCSKKWQSHHYNQSQSSPEVKKKHSTSEIETMKEPPNVLALTQVTPQVQRSRLKFQTRVRDLSLTFHLPRHFLTIHKHTYWPLAVLRISIISLSQITSIITTLHLNFRYLINMLTSINILLLIILLQAREQIFHHKIVNFVLTTPKIWSRVVKFY